MATDDEIKRRIRKAAIAGRIVIAPQDGIQQFGPLAQQFLKNVFGCEGALITDESSLSDFLPHPVVGRLARISARLSMYNAIHEHYGVDARQCTYILDVLRLIEARRAAKVH